MNLFSRNKNHHRNIPSTTTSSFKDHSIKHFDRIKENVGKHFTTFNESVNDHFAKIDIQIDKHFENFAFCFKVIIILLLLIWIGVLCAKMYYQRKIKKNNNQYDTNKLSKLVKTLNIVNDINYYLILIFTLIIIFIMLFKLRKYIYVIIQHGKDHLKHIHDKYIKNIKDIQMPDHSETAEVSKQFLSIIWWLLLYFVFIICIIVVDKVTKKEEATEYL
jgi:amino acid permease